MTGVPVWGARPGPSKECQPIRAGPDGMQGISADSAERASARPDCSAAMRRVGKTTSVCGDDDGRHCHRTKNFREGEEGRREPVDGVEEEEEKELQID